MQLAAIPHFSTVTTTAPYTMSSKIRSLATDAAQDAGVEVHTFHKPIIGNGLDSLTFRFAGATQDAVDGAASVLRAVVEGVPDVTVG